VEHEHNGHARHHTRALRSTPIAKPESFHRTLVVCNAFPDSEKVAIVKNRKERVASDLGFKQCRHITTPVEEGDQLEFQSKHAGSWTFQVGELPQADAKLLLVFEKRDAETKVPSFQSFAFPASSDAQLAVIDAYRGKASRGQVHVEDVAKWLESIELGSLADLFRTNSVDGELLLTLSGEFDSLF